jgi:hypothetical protein
VNDEFATVAEAESSFGGLFIDSTGSPVVLLTNVGRLSNVRAAGVNAMLQKRLIPTATIRVQTVAYGFKMLRQWYDAAQSTSGYVRSAIDVAHNRLYFGVLTADAQRALSRELSTLGIPSAAVAVDVVGPIVSTAVSSPEPPTLYLGSHVRPLRAGLRLRRPQAADHYCTAGLTAHTNGSSPDSAFAFTPTHCSSHPFAVASDEWYQADPTVSTDDVGHEIAYSKPFTQGCTKNPRYNGCVMSDAMRILANSGVSLTPGLVARTYYHDTTLVADTTPQFYVTGEAVPPFQGQTVWKVGAASGQSSGAVEYGCIDVLNQQQI